MAHDIQYLFDNITSRQPRSLGNIKSDLDDLEYLMSIDRRKIALANMDKKKRKLIVELDRAKEKVQQSVSDRLEKL